uniref:Protein phosphatase with EF-hand domain 2 n=1 Tax=Cynoglossus semilaevis TaxID=244447 RepID=A0A3P8UM38_CYNSE
MQCKIIFLKKKHVYTDSTHHFTVHSIRAAVLIQRWYRRYVARLEIRRRCTWNIFQSIEYAGQQDQIKLYNFFVFLMQHFTPASSERNLISHIFHDDPRHGAQLETFHCYESIEVSNSYTGPRLTFPLTFCGVSKLVETFKHRQVGALAQTVKHIPGRK